MAEARVQARNERRKKARLLKKAAALSPQDLERIAALKRCGLRDPSLGVPAGGDSAHDGTSPTSASACSAAAPSRSQSSGKTKPPTAQAASEAPLPDAAAPVAGVADPGGNSEAEEAEAVAVRAASGEEGMDL